MIAGTKIEAGEMVYIREDGKAYPARPSPATNGAACWCRLRGGPRDGQLVQWRQAMPGLYHPPMRWIAFHDDGTLSYSFGDRADVGPYYAATAEVAEDGVPIYEYRGEDRR